MVTGASTADLAVILIDARKGVLTQTRRHSYLVSLLGIRHVVLAVNKMDLVGYSQDVVRRDRRRLPRVRRSSSASTTSSCIPLSALQGRQRHRRAATHMPWYHGPDAARAPRDGRRSTTSARDRPFRMPVQWVNRPEPRLPRLLRARSSAARCARATRSACCRRAARARSRASSRCDGDLDDAVAGQSVTLTLADEIDVSRGDVLAAADAPPAVADQFEATLVWMSERAAAARPRRTC